MLLPAYAPVARDLRPMASTPRSKTILALGSLIMGLVFVSHPRAPMVLANSGDGGAVPGTSSVEISGTANAPYLLLFSGIEKSWSPGG